MGKGWVTAVGALLLWGTSIWGEEPPAPVVIPPELVDPGQTPCCRGTKVSIPAPHSAHYWTAPGERFWASAEYLLWWIKDAPVPVPLLTASDPRDAGILTRSSTRVLLGAEDVNSLQRSGARIGLGLWLEPEQLWGVEGQYLFLGARSVHRAASVPGDRQGVVLAVPFVDANPNSPGESSSLVSTPDAFSGAADLAIRSRLWGVEFNGVANLACGPRARWDLLAGFRYLDVAEGLTYRTSSPDFPVVNPDDTFITTDQFDARNPFYGGQVGTRVSFTSGRFFLSATAKVALGSVRQEVGVRGSTVTNDFTGSTGPTTTFPGGYFAQRSNLGDHGRNRFAAVPEVSVQAGGQLTSWLRAFVGYNFLYLSDAVRPGDHMSRVLNSSQSEALSFSPTLTPTGPARPAFAFESADFWAQGITFGLEIRY